MSLLRPFIASALLLVGGAFRLSLFGIVEIASPGLLELRSMRRSGSIRPSWRSRESSRSSSSGVSSRRSNFTSSSAIVTPSTSTSLRTSTVWYFSTAVGEAQVTLDLGDDLPRPRGTSGTP